MSASSPKRTLERGPCITIKAEEPCTATSYNHKGHPDCNEPSPKRIRSSTASGLRKSPNKWTKEENQKLTALVAHYGEKKWKRISADLGGLKTGAQCAQHWKRVLSPDIRKGHWDEIEEDLLLRLVIQYGSCWKKIAKKIPQRTDIQCRYQYLKAKQSREVPWDPKEDDVLIKKVVEMANCGFAKFTSDSNVSCDKGSSANDTPLIGASSTAVPSCYVNNHIFADKENNAHGYSCASSDSATNPTSTGWNCSNVGFCSELHRVVWLEVAEHMARMKLTSSLRTALECKTRFTELLGTTFNSASQEEDSHKCFGPKGSGNAFASSNPLFTTLPSINTHLNDNNRVTDANNNTINISISNNSDKNNNNITITNNTFSHNITINITNTHNPFTTNNTVQPLTKSEPNLKPTHKEITPPTLPLPNFHTVMQPLVADTKQTQSIVVMSFLSGLDSLATVASTLPHEVLVSDPPPTCKATNLS